jgi:hypothetical protein
VLVRDDVGAAIENSLPDLLALVVVIEDENPNRNYRRQRECNKKQDYDYPEDCSDLVAHCGDAVIAATSVLRSVGTKSL